MTPSHAATEAHATVVAFFPAHRAHLTAMRNISSSSSLLSGHVYVAVLRTPRTVRTHLRKVEPGYYEIEWPSTLHGTSLDGGAAIEARKIGRFLIRRFGSLQFAVSGDFQGEHALTARIISQETGAVSVLIPEGLGVFRKITDGYPWIVRNWKSSIGLIVTDTFREVADWVASAVVKSRSRRWKRRLRPFWRVLRILTLAFRRPGTNDLSKSSNFQAAVSNWPHDVMELLGVPNSEHVAPKWSVKERTALKIGQIRMEYDALLVHQSLGLTRTQWTQVLGRLAPLNLSSVLVKPDRHNLDLECFLSALRDALPKTQIELYRGDSSAEELAVSLVVSQVVSVTSTALFNLACMDRPPFSLVSLALPYLELQKAHIEKPDIESIGYAFLPLRLTGRGNRLRFL